MSSTTPDMPRVAASRIARVNWGASAAALLLLMLCPLFMGDYYLHAMILAMVFLLPALGLTPRGRCGLPAQLPLQVLHRVQQ